MQIGKINVEEETFKKRKKKKENSPPLKVRDCSVVVLVFYENRDLTKDIEWSRERIEG